jgi:hypothetical protein
MKKSNKILIGLIFITIIGLLAQNVKSEDYPNLFKPSDTYTYTNTVVNNYPTVDNNYRIEISKQQILKYQLPYIYQIEFNKPTVYSKYFINQYLLEFSEANTYLDNCGYEGQGNDLYIFYKFIFYNGATFKFRTTVLIRFYDFGITLGFYGDSTTIYYYFSNYSVSIDDIKTIEVDCSNKISNGSPNDALTSEINIYVNDIPIISYNRLMASYPTTPNNNVHFEITEQKYIGNYNPIVGIRYFYYHSTDYVDNFFNFPKYKIDSYVLSETSIEELEYWNYISYKLDYSDNLHVEFSENITVLGNEIEQIFEYDFQTTEGTPYTCNYYYTSIVLENSALGDWSILWNWLRNGLVFILNTTFLLIQFFCYILVAGVNVLFGFLFIALIIPFVWNILVYWMLFGASGMIFYAYISIIVILLLIFEAIAPLLQFIITEGLPALIYGLIVVMSWIFALLFFLITLGKGNLFQIQSVIEMFLSEISLFFVNGIPFILKYIPELLSYSVFYILLIGFGYIKLVYVKSKGFVNRSKELECSLNTYIMPIELGYSILSKIKQLLIGWM